MEGLSNLGIDAWGLVLYLVNFGLLALVLTKFLYKPVLKMLDERRDHIQSNLEEAERLRREFEEEMTKRSHEAEEMQKHMRLELEEQRRHAETRAKEMMLEAKRERETMIQEAERTLAEAKARLVKDVEDELLEKIERIVVTITEEKAEASDLEASVERAWKQLRNV